MNYWLVKSEPESYSWDAFVKEKRAAWTGVRNFQARNNLRAMKRGDLVLFYHSVSEKQIVGIARVEKEAYADATAKEGDWSCVDLVPVKVAHQARHARSNQIRQGPGRNAAGEIVADFGHVAQRGAVQACAGAGGNEALTEQSVAAGAGICYTCATNGNGNTAIRNARRHGAGYPQRIFSPLAHARDNSNCPSPAR